MYKAEDYRIEMYWSDEDNCFIARAPEFEGCMSHGNTQSKCLKKIKEAIQLCIDIMREDGEDLPVPLSKATFSGKLSLRIDPDLHKKTAIAAKGKGDSINKFIEKAIEKAV